MKTQEEIFDAILADQAITDIVLEASALNIKEDDVLQPLFPLYFRLCAALSECITRLDLSGEHAPDKTVGAGVYIPYVTIGMPAFSDYMVTHWSAAYMTQQGIDKMFFNEEAEKRILAGEGGEPNYLHGVLLLDVLGSTIVQLAGTSLMMAAAVNLNDVLGDITADVPKGVH